MSVSVTGRPGIDSRKHFSGEIHLNFVFVMPLSEIISCIVLS